MWGVGESREERRGHEIWVKDGEGRKKKEEESKKGNWMSLG